MTMENTLTINPHLMLYCILTCSILGLHVCTSCTCTCTLHLYYCSSSSSRPISMSGLVGCVHACVHVSVCVCMHVSVHVVCVGMYT